MNFMSREVVIVEAVRSPIGRRNGLLSQTHAVALAAHAIQAVLSRSGIDPLLVDQVVFGCVTQVGEQSINVGRQAWLHAKLPIEVPATTLDFQCGSSQQAVHIAAGLIASGQAEVIIAGGVEHMTRVPMGSNFLNGPGTPYTESILEDHDIRNQGISAEWMAQRWGITREEADHYGYQSHMRAHHATTCGWFDAEIAPLEVQDENGNSLALRHDEGIRPETTLEKMATLKTPFMEDGIVTAGNASQISDGSAALLVMSLDRAQALGLKPRARLVAQTVVGVDPALMLSGPIPATRKVLDRAGLTLDDIDLIEINEAFATVVLAWQREYDPDMNRVNVNGGAIALGHPLGASGSRLMVTLLHALERTGGRYGLQTMCCGGGMGTGTIIERLD
jgi:acetyl-CoA acetyltransferase family protein